MTILDKIVIAKQEEISKRKKEIDISELKNSSLFEVSRPSFYNSLKTPGPSVITEFKRKSPSKGVLNDRVDILDVTKGYEAAGASAISILTDLHFDGKAEDLTSVFEKVKVPLLRKDFIIDVLQIYEARALGASAILLIAAILDKNQLEEMSQLSQELKLDVLFEIHDEDELDKIPAGAKIVGINNRDLRTFEVNLEQSISLAQRLPGNVLKVSESGISSVSIINDLYNKDFEAFLIGEKFMVSEDPGAAAREFLAELRSTYSAKK